MGTYVGVDLDVLTARSPGIYDLPESMYFASTALSSSGARLLLPPSCPALYRWIQDHPRASTAAFDEGHAAHQLVLGAGQPIAVIDAEDWRTKAAKEAAAEARDAGEIPLLAHQTATVYAMASALRQHPVASALLDPAAGGQPEQSLFWTDPDSGVRCRARLDWLPETPPDGRLIIADYKTTTSAEPAAIAKSVLNYGYDQQDAWYRDGARALELADPADVAFVFIFQEKTPPYLVTVAELDPAAQARGRHWNRRAREVFAECSATGTWPAYTDDIELITLPRWADLPEGNS